MLHLGRRFFCRISWRSSYNSGSIEEAIERHTRISREHLTPEIGLHLLTPDCPLYTAPQDDREPVRYFEEPFWSIYWPGGQAVARYILDEGGSFIGGGSRLLDLGAGCGAAAIAARMMGAEDVLANDIDEVACVAARMNAQLNELEIRTSSQNLLQPRTSPGDFDVVVIGDLLYDEALASSLEAWLDGSLKPGTKILLGDPGRHGLGPKLRKRLRHLRTYPLPDNVRRENHGYSEAAVWQFMQRQ